MLTKNEIMAELETNPRVVKLACLMLEVSKLSHKIEEASIFLPPLVMGLVKELIGADASQLIHDAREYAIKIACRENEIEQKLAIPENQIN